MKRDRERERERERDRYKEIDIIKQTNAKEKTKNERKTSAAAQGYAGEVRRDEEEGGQAGCGSLSEVRCTFGQSLCVGNVRIWFDLKRLH